jgi:zinc transporter
METVYLRPSSSPVSDDGAAGEGDAWVDIDLADDEGRRWLASQSGLDEDIVRRLLEPAQITCWRRFGRGLHSHLSIPVADGERSTIRTVDLGFWLEPGRIITVRDGNVAVLEKAAKACATGAGPSSSWGLIVFVLAEGLSRLEQILQKLTATIDELEDEALTGQSEPAIHRLGDLERRLIHARRFRVPLANLISFIASQSPSDLHDALRDELEQMASTLAQYQELLDLSIERALALQGQLRDQLADSMNTATYRFTWVATVFLPLGFITGLLGINVAGVPGDHNPAAFWLVCGALCVVAAAWGVAVGRVTSPFRTPSVPRGPRGQAEDGAAARP